MFDYIGKSVLVKVKRRAIKGIVRDKKEHYWSGTQYMIEFDDITRWVNDSSILEWYK